jgi:hypothetical protein
MSDARFRRVTDLFVRGKTIDLPDGSHLWVQVINAYERDECLSDAQTARARLILALKEKGDERTKVQARLADYGRPIMEADLARARASAKIPQVLAELRDDPEWKERMDIVLRTDFDEASKPATSEEIALLADIQQQVLAEMNTREQEETEYLTRKFARMSDEEFLEDWVHEWIERRGTELATGEYQLTEIWYATRYCEAQTDELGNLSHARCNGHRDRVFPTKSDARAAPNELQELIRIALSELNMAGSDPKDLASPPSSSASPPQPSAEAASTPSTSTVTPPPPPGT